ncbi:MULTISPECIES: MFS transporter [Pseudomonas]|jgi:MFS family permease|uniref:MFS transporter n=1 Tax=Pseudomonas TaxID=286 RepID=UPI000D0185DB|nr:MULTISPECIES: MFS transporter [Pseudomonas]MDR2319970.1 MFS transporter [Pseudomonas sp.]MDD2137657.1 MFS transporter [Pseudomonas kurunegalensis]PRN04362.1 MFS transporter [Pseudomonas sp. LLC-1]PYG72376.1 putative MFS family arabinose efflux permease [Pseudomonas sp. RV120224-01c]PYG76866.1 putative MFS family arabinose efflux permease [Pseudomonas sp. RV120224-01b]
MSDSAPQLLRHHRPFLAFWLARVFTASGFQMLTVAIGWHLYQLTGNVLDLGLVGLVEFAPRVLFMLHTGHVADRYDRRKVAALCQSLQGLIALALAVGSATDNVTRELIFALAFLLGATRSFEMPATQALLPNVVPPGLFPRAVAASASATQSATIVAPAVGGFLYAFGSIWVYGPTVALYAIACVLTLSLQARGQVVQRGRASIESLLAGIRFIRSRPDILGAISLDLFAVLLGGATALLPVFAKDILLTGPLGLGLLRSAPAVGALLMSVWLARFPFERNVGRTMFTAVGVFGVATIAFGLSTSFWFSLAVLVVLGAADMISMVIRGAFVQLETPDEMRGRVSAVNGLFIGASNQLGEFESGVTAHWFGTVPAVVMGGVGTLVVTGVWIKLFPTLAKRDRLHNG